MEIFNTHVSVSDTSRKESASVENIHETIKIMLLLLFPMVPHFCSEMWKIMNLDHRPEELEWPAYDEEAAKEELLTIVIQVNGKVRSRLEVPAETENDRLEKLALNDENVLRFVDSKPVKKVIVIKKKLVNIVV